jgi:hypothetical protein
MACLAAGGIVAGGASCANGTAGHSVSVPEGGYSDTTMSGDDSPATQDSPVSMSTCDANTQNDYLNCGMCNHRCAVGDICSCGTCMAPCDAGLTECCGSCVDTTKDPLNCGMCQKECLPPTSGSGTATCVSSSCSFTCPLDAGGPEGGKIIQCEADSGAAGCFDPTNSPQACGGCGISCGSGNVCLESMCCAQGSAVCGGKCENVQDSSTSCGACDAGCPSPATCSSGVCTGYGATNPTTAFIDACSLPNHTTVLASQFGWMTTNSLTLPISFNFYGTAETQVFIGNEGTIGFGATTVFMDDFPSCSNPDPFDNYPAIVLFGDDNMDTGPDGVCYALVGSADGGISADASVPSDAAAGDGGAPTGRQFVVTWEQASYETVANSVMTFSLVLSEGSNTIDFMYETMSSGADAGINASLGGASATVGMQNGQGLDTPISCNAQFIQSTPYNIHLAPL